MKITPFEPIDPIDPDLQKELMAAGNAAMGLWLNPPAPRKPTEAERKLIAEIFDVPLIFLPR